MKFSGCVCVNRVSRALDSAIIPGSHRWLLPEQSRVEKGPKAFAIFLLQHSAFILLI